MIVAPGCAACDVLLEEPSAGPVCQACWESLDRLNEPLCPRCGDPLPAGRLAAAALWVAGADSPLSDSAVSTCPRCSRTPSLIARSRAIGEYSGALRTLVHLLKYGRRQSLAPRLSALMATSGADVLRGADCAIPVPLHWSRTWQRGFNQAALLAAGLGPPVWPALRRVRVTRPQVELTAAQRRRNVRAAFSIARRKWPWERPWAMQLAGKVVVVVDDVATTGATLEACARVLRKAGVREVRALTAARVVGSPR